MPELIFIKAGSLDDASCSSRRRGVDQLGAAVVAALRERARLERGPQ